jgi:hypothetical protein
MKMKADFLNYIIFLLIIGILTLGIITGTAAALGRHHENSGTDNSYNDNSDNENSGTDNSYNDNSDNDNSDTDNSYNDNSYNDNSDTDNSKAKELAKEKYRESNSHGKHSR